MKEILRFSFYILLGHLGQMAFNFSDLFVCSRYSSSASGSLSVANGIFALFLVVGLGITIVISSLVSFHRSQNNEETLSGHYLSSYFMVSLISSVILFVGLLILTKFLNIFHITHELEAGVLTYLNVTANSLIPAILFSCYKEFLQGHEKTYLPNILLMVFNLINFALNIVLVNGHGPFPEMGILGSAIATNICRWSMLIILFFYMKKLYFKNSNWKDIFATDWNLTIEMLKMGLPLSANILLEVGVFSFTTIISGGLGIIPAAAHGIVLNIISLAFMFPLSIASASAVKIAYEKGQNNYKEASQTIINSFILILILATLISFLFIFFSKEVAGIMTSDSEVIKLASFLIFIAGIFQIADGIQVTASGLLRGLGETKFPSLFYVINYWLIGLPLGYYLGITQKRGVYGLWIGLASAVFLMAFSNASFLFYFFKKLKTKPA